MPWTIKHSAASTALLHFAKHGSETVVAGVFLGRSQISEVVQAVPLVHCWALAPTMTAALAMVAEFAKDASLEICGFYASTAAILKQLTPMVTGRAGKAGVIGVVLEANGTLKVVEGQGQVELDEAKMEAAVKKGAYADVVDFDDHLEDPSKDFLGRFLIAE
jgi:hypothetical protein